MSPDRQAATHLRGRLSASRNSLPRAVRITVAVLAAGLFLAVPGYGDSTRTVDIEINNGKVVGKKSARVVKGDTVVLRWRSDQRLKLHLHGYDVETTVSPGTPAEMKIRARATGRFPVEIHGQSESGGHSHDHRTIFHLDVYPE
jgi:hypothetical protein